MFGLEFVIGGLFRLFPEILKLWNEKKQRDHEREMFELNLKADELRGKQEMQKLELQGNIQMDVEQVKAIVAASQAQAQSLPRTGYWFLDTLIVLAEVASSFVRPALTYWFCILMYGAYKWASYRLLVNAGAEWDAAVKYLWTETDYSIMLSIIGFWFVDRAIRRQGKPA
jgi:hypothetical protein